MLNSNKTLTAKEARSLYFEDYVYFENYVRRLAQKLNIKTENKALKEVIFLIKKIKSKKRYQEILYKLNINLILENNNVRNWLAHTYADFLCSRK